MLAVKQHYKEAISLFYAVTVTGDSCNDGNIPAYHCITKRQLRNYQFDALINLLKSAVFLANQVTWRCHMTSIGEIRIRCWNTANTP